MSGTKYNFTDISAGMNDETFPQMINDSGEIAGNYNNGTTYEGFIYNNGTYTDIVNPSQSSTGNTSISAINASGEVAGTYTNGTTDAGFVYANGTYTNIVDPSQNGAAGTYVSDINDSGEVVGYYAAGSASLGFIYSNGTYTTLEDPLQSANGNTYPAAINDTGEVVGSYFNGSNTEGFIYNNGTYTTVADPNQSATGYTFFTAINASGEVAGNYTDGTSAKGFIYNNGTYTTIVDPNEGPNGNTTIAAINASGEVAGYYYNGTTVVGFVYDNGTYTDIVSPSQGGGSAGLTLVTGINDSGELTGYYNNGTTYVGFTAEVACFCAGTRIRTIIGDIAVEQLQPGDLIITATGVAPLRWVGKRHLQIGRHPRPEKLRPVLITAHALGEKIPCRDLLVSPDHALYFENMLVPAKTLLNGVTIRQIDVPSVTYYHLELPSHDILYAENTPAESYLDTGNRNMFEDDGDAMILHPDFGQVLRVKNSCAPLVEDGPAVEAIRARILRRAQIRTSDDPELNITYRYGAAFITSRSAIPGELTPDPRDRRRLGVKIGSLSVAGDAIPLDHSDLSDGWHDMEPDGRWTDGRALIPASVLKGSRNVTVTIAATMAYPVTEAAETAMAG